MNEFFLHNNCHFNLTVQLTWKITWSRPRQEKLELILSFFLISAHLNHIRTVAGINHVGIGASYDGINALVPTYYFFLKLLFYHLLKIQ